MLVHLCSRDGHKDGTLMGEWCSLWGAKLLGCWFVLTGKAVPVPIPPEGDTTIIIIETEGSTVNFVSCRNLVGTRDSYNLLLSKVILWVSSKNRFFWTSDHLGGSILEQAEEEFEIHKNSA